MLWVWSLKVGVVFRVVPRNPPFKILCTGLQSLTQALRQVLLLTGQVMKIKTKKANYVSTIGSFFKADIATQNY